MNTGRFFSAFTGFVFSLLCTTGLCAPLSRPGLPTADRTWMEIQVPVPDFPQEQGADPAARKAALAARAAAFTATADRAKAFYTQYSQHEKASEAKLAEVRALVSATQTGDATVEGRLASTVRALRSDRSVPPSIRVQIVSAYGFSHQMRGMKNHEERLTAIEQVARGLVVEFPEQSQGYDSLLTVACTTGDDLRAKKIARELLAMPSSTAVKDEARQLLARFELVGRPLRDELEGADETTVKGALRQGLPTIVYTWSAGSRGSLALAADLTKLAPNANIIGLNLDTDSKAAEVVALQAGLSGTLIYDGRGREGALAQRLKMRNAAQVVLVDAQGIIRDVRGESGLKAKLKQFGP